MNKSRVGNQVETNQSRPWQQGHVDEGPNASYNPKRNFNRQPIAINFENTPSWGNMNQLPNWNGPLYNPIIQNHMALVWNQFVVCFPCGEIGHYMGDYPNPMKIQQYIPLCGNCKEA